MFLCALFTIVNSVFVDSEPYRSSTPSAKAALLQQSVVLSRLQDCGVRVLVQTAGLRCARFGAGCRISVCAFAVRTAGLLCARLRCELQDCCVRVCGANSSESCL